MDTENEFQRLTAASDLCCILAMFLNLPDVRLAEGIATGTLQEDIRQILQELHWQEDIHCKEFFDDSCSQKLQVSEILHSLRQEYTRLFTHPDTPLICIHEALFRYKAEQQAGERPIPFLNPAALEARQRYQETGFQSSYSSNESEDHMGREIEFLSWLFLQRAKDSDNKGTNWKKHFDEFWQLHIARWGREFFYSCRTLTISPMYKMAGTLGEMLCGEKGVCKQ